MAEVSVSETSRNALLMFVDIVDSSVYSSILGVQKFAKKVLSYQVLFESLGGQYFDDKPYFAERIDSLCEVLSRGDEGLVFVIDGNQEGAELVHKAIKFALELKARLKILNKREIDLPPTEMKIAAGIHYGQVAILTRPEVVNGVNRSPIYRIIGYAINKAKRVESSSRIGVYSQVFLSKEAADLMSGYAVALHKHRTSLKGVESNEEVYELRSGFFDNIPLPENGSAVTVTNEELVDFVTKNYNNPELLREPWFRSFALSVLECCKTNAESTSDMEAYQEKASEIAWRRMTEDDPILLYWRALDCKTRGKATRAVSHLREVIARQPGFVDARIRIVELCFEILKSKTKSSSETLFVRDTAEEFLDKYEKVLSETEKQLFQDILNETSQQRRFLGKR